MNTAIIAAAGSGSRFGPEKPKQFVLIAGRPMILHTIGRFASCAAVDEIIVVAAADRVGYVTELIERDEPAKPLRVVAGGPSRAASVHNGLLAASAQAEVVAVHDAARPMVTPYDIEIVIKRAAETGAACLAVPMVDTVKQAESGWITGTLDRRTLWRAMTPQAFRRDVLLAAFEQAQISDAVTDECSLVERLGVPIAIVEGDPRNIKVTTAADLAVAEFYIGEQTK